ncbi:MAG: class B sortase [Coprococcus sp.]|nr:class B sortase [Coprococcus sp.]
MGYDERDDKISEYESGAGISEEVLDAAIKLAQKIVQENKLEKVNGEAGMAAVKDHKKPLVRKKCKKGWVLLLIGSLVLLICSACFIVYYILSHRRSEMNIEEMRKIVKHEYQYSDSDSISGAAELTIPIDFHKLREINPDIYAWIYIPGTEVDYPVLQNDDDSFYLTHDSNGDYSVDGAIYTEKINSKKFDDFNTVLYGHNMKNGSMFRSLHSYEEPEFLDNHRYVYIYTPESIIVYRVFAVYRYDDRHILNSYDFSNDEIKKSYIEYIYNMKSLYATVKNDETVDVDSHILTLSTCCGDEDERLLVQAVQVEIKTP